MTHPVGELPYDAQRLTAAEGVRRIPGEPLVSEIGIVLELATWLHDVDALTRITRRELGAPHRGIEGCREVDVRHGPALLVVRFASGLQQFAHCEVCLGAVQVHTGFEDLDGHRLTHPPAAILDTSAILARSTGS